MATRMVRRSWARSGLWRNRAVAYPYHCLIPGGNKKEESEDATDESTELLICISTSPGQQEYAHRRGAAEDADIVGAGGKYVGVHEGVRRLADSIEQLSMHSDENIDNLKSAVSKIDKLGGKSFSAEHELHSFKKFLASYPIKPPTRSYDVRYDHSAE